MKQTVSIGDSGQDLVDKLDGNFSELYSDAHAHANAAVLAKLGEAAGQPTFDGQPIKGEPGKDGATGGKGDTGERGATGKDGTDGAPGFSPIISVASDTDTEYVLSIQQQTGTLTTPNLKGSFGATGGGVIVSPYDLIIRTQADFEALYNSPTWLGAASIAFIGDGGNLKFTRETTGLLIPDTVRRIDGFNKAIIEITNFVYSGTKNFAAVWYADDLTEFPKDADYCIDNIMLICSSDTRAAGFGKCATLKGCSASVTSSTSNPVYAFRDCGNLINCKVLKADSLSLSAIYGFSGCNYLVNCIASTCGNGFYSCQYLLNCVGIGNNAKGTGVGFYGCNYLSNCRGSGIGAEGYAFYNCQHLNGCGKYLSVTTAIWGGTWNYRDDASCQLT